MKQNKYDDPAFFQKYSQLKRSVKGLKGAGEWQTFKRMLPEFKGKRVLDLGCGYGWHSQYAFETGAKSVVGVDISQKMIEVAREKTSDKIEYVCKPIEDLDFPKNSFDVIISSLTFHYIKSFDEIVDRVSIWLVKGGDFVFSVEHPVYTSNSGKDFVRDSEGKALYFPVNNYYSEGKRDTNFLGEQVIKYHRTLTTYLNKLIKSGFEIIGIEEPQPSEEFLKTDENMRDELRRPLFLIVSSKKK